MATFDYNAFWWYDENGNIVGSSRSPGQLTDNQPGDTDFTPSDTLATANVGAAPDDTTGTYLGTIELTNLPGVTWVGVEQGPYTVYYANVPDSLSTSEINDLWRTQFGNPHVASTVEPSLQNTTGFVTCFAEGTLIATARGEVPVEQLRAGDLVLTARGFGAPLQPVRWVGRLHVNIARHPAPAKAAPILIKAGALAEGVPARDLRVSPEHALFLDDRLVPAHVLVNGTSIVQELWCREVTYFHVELPAHGLLIAEGTAAESYFDDGNRHLFDNHAVTALVKDFASERANGRYRAAACAPVVEDGPALERIRLGIAARAGALGAARAG
jgi:hypothetical protein